MVIGESVVNPIIIMLLLAGSDELNDKYDTNYKNYIRKNHYGVRESIGVGTFENSQF